MALAYFDVCILKQEVAVIIKHYQQFHKYLSMVAMAMMMKLCNCNQKNV